MDKTFSIKKLFEKNPNWVELERRLNLAKYDEEGYSSHYSYKCINSVGAEIIVSHIYLFPHPGSKFKEFSFYELEVNDTIIASGVSERVDPDYRGKVNKNEVEELYDNIVKFFRDKHLKQIDSIFD